MAGTGRAAPARRRRRAASVVAVLAVAAALGGCTGQEQSGTPSQRVTTWMRSVGGAGIGNVEVASRNIDLVIATHNVAAAVREACALLSNEAQTAIGNLPAPDEQLTNQLDTAYMDATAAGDDCYGGAGGNAKLLARSAKERTELMGLLATAVDHVRSVTGQTPTTDTTAPQSGGDPFGGGT